MPGLLGFRVWGLGLGFRIFFKGIFHSAAFSSAACKLPLEPVLSPS